MLLVLGGDALLRGAVALARRLGVSPLVIGVTVVSLGSTMPELVTSVSAALAGAPALAAGNAVGSNIANILLILGASALIRPVAFDRLAFRRDGAMPGLVTLVAAGAFLSGTVTRPVAVLLLLLLAGFFLLTILRQRAAADPDPGTEPAPGLRLALLLAAGGLAMVILGAVLTVRAAIAVARDLGVAETVIGLTIVAVGTSLPEFVTAVMGALRGRSDLALGNVTGASILNLAAILPAAALIAPFPTPGELLSPDLWVLLGATVALAVVAPSRGRVSRAEGGVLVLAYALWLGAQVLRS